MPYSSTSDLPPAVTAKLKGKKRRQWMHVWNDSFSRHGDEKRAFAEAWATVKKAGTPNVKTPATLPPLGAKRAKAANFPPPPTPATDLARVGRHSRAPTAPNPLAKGTKPMSDFRLFLPLSKVEKQRDGTVIVEGYASTPTEDMDGEIVTLDAVKAALPNYMRWANIREMHKLSAVGTAENANVDKAGLFVRSRISDPIAAKKCLDRVYKGYSIGGSKLEKVGNRITEIDLIEISLVDRPNNPDCRIALAKSARGVKGEVGGYLLKALALDTSETEVDSGRRERNIAKLAKAAARLAKDGPPAARDGFSLPAPVGKANASPKDDSDENNKIAGDAPAGNAPPPPLETPAEKKARKKAKKAKKLAKLQREQRAITTLPPTLELEVSMPALDLTKGAAVGADDFTLTPKDNNTMTDGIDENTIKAALAVLAKAGMSGGGTMPTRFQRVQAAQSNLKAVKATRVECAKAIKAAHDMHKSAYLAKAAKGKSKDDNDGDEGFDHAGAMEKLQKAYGALEKMGTFVKAARGQLKKAAARTSNGGTGPTDGDTFFTVPSGVKALSISDLANASPGGEGKGSAPPEYPTDGSVYSGKAAKGKTGRELLAKFADKDGRVPVDLMDIVTQNATLEGELTALRRVPASVGGRRPYAFDMTKVIGATDSDTRDSREVLFKGVDPAALNSEDEGQHTEATAKVIGNLLTSGRFGKSIMSADFKGGVVGRGE